MLMAPCPVAQSEDSFLSVLPTLYGWAWMVLYTTHIQLTHNSTAQNRTEHTAASHSELRSSFARAQCSSAREQRLSVVHWIVMEINASPHPPSPYLFCCKTQTLFLARTHRSLSFRVFHPLPHLWMTRKISMCIYSWYSAATVYHPSPTSREDRFQGWE